jgi:hypothetical protein
MSKPLKLLGGFRRRTVGRLSLIYLCVDGVGGDDDEYGERTACGRSLLLAREKTKKIDIFFVDLIIFISAK